MEMEDRYGSLTFLGWIVVIAYGLVLSIVSFAVATLCGKPDAALLVGMSFHVGFLFGGWAESKNPDAP